MERKYTNNDQKYTSIDRYSKKIYELININIKKKAVEIGGGIIKKRFDGTPGYESFYERFELPDYVRGKKFKPGVRNQWVPIKNESKKAFKARKAQELRYIPKDSSNCLAAS